MSSWTPNNTGHARYGALGLRAADPRCQGHFPAGRWQVTCLLSPPSTPRYNGSVEAGAGALKTRIFYQATRHGTLDVWTSDDVEAARMQANFANWPWGPRGRTPQQVWQARTPITPQDREEFRQTVAAKMLELRRDNGLEHEPLTLQASAALDRAAIRAALEALGYLGIRRRRVSPPFNSPLRDKIR